MKKVTEVVVTEFGKYPQPAAGRAVNNVVIPDYTMLRLRGTDRVEMYLDIRLMWASRGIYRASVLGVWDILPEVRK